MSGLELTYAFATIVGLLCNFKQARDGNEFAGHQEFMEWLESHRHEDVKRMISDSAHLQQEIAALLRQDSKALLAQMADVEKMLSQLLSRASGFSQVSRTIHPEYELSDQAIDILCQLANSTPGMMGVTVDAHPITGEDCDVYFFPTQADFLPPEGFRPNEPKFFADDLATLVLLGLIRIERDGEETHPIYRITRFGDTYAKNVSQQVSQAAPARLVHGIWN